MKRRWSSLLLLAALGALALAGCGGGSSSSGTESTTVSSAKEGKAGMFEISEEGRACLKEKGVELPEFKSGAGPPGGGAQGGRPEPGQMPEGGPAARVGGAGSEKMTKAFEECGVEAPQFKAGPAGGGGRPDVNSAAFRKQVKEYVACVRENGYELAEPDFSGEGPIFEKAESESAAFKKASEKCQDLLGAPGATEARSG